MEKRAFGYLAMALTTFILWMLYTDINALMPLPDLTDTLLRTPPTGINLTIYSSIAGTFWEYLFIFIYLGIYILSIPFAVLYVTFKERNLAAETILGISFVVLLSCIVYSFFYVQAPHDVFGTNPLEGTFQRKFVNDKMLLPSLHVGISTVLALTLSKSRKKIIRISYIVIAPLVWLSVLALLQHWFYDVVSGVLLAALAVKLAEKYAKRFDLWIERIDEKKIKAWFALALLLAGAYSTAKLLR